jgi:hypothetical protein
MMGVYKKSDYYLNKSIYFNQKVNNQKGLAISYINLGVLCLSLEKIDEAGVLFKKSYEICREINDSQIINGALLNIRITNSGSE